jgi:predicted nucleic acid-binding protein
MVYLDASVTFSLYGVDRNTPGALSLIRHATLPLLLSALCELETLNAISLRVFRGDLSERDAARVRLNFQADLIAGVYKQRPLPLTAFDRAFTLSERITPTIGVRAADLLHIAAALELGASTLYTFDQKQKRAAQAAGLIVN